MLVPAYQTGHPPALRGSDGVLLHQAESEREPRFLIAIQPCFTKPPTIVRCERIVTPPIIPAVTSLVVVLTRNGEGLDGRKSR